MCEEFQQELFIFAVGFFDNFHFVSQNTVEIIFQNMKTAIKTLTIATRSFVIYPNISLGFIINKTWLEGFAKTVLIYTKMCSFRLIP